VIDKEWAKDMIIFFGASFFILYGLINIGIFFEERESQIISPQAHDMGDGVTCYTYKMGIDCLEVVE